MRALAGLLLALLGVAAALAPQTVFPVCERLVETASGGLLPMKCHWTAQAALGIGFASAFGGLALALARDPGVRLGVSLMTCALGVLLILVPALLVGVCGGATMPCRMGTMPALELLGGLEAVVSALAALRSARALKGGRRP